jgi:hypothetical protein
MLVGAIQLDVPARTKTGLASIDIPATVGDSGEGQEAMRHPMTILRTGLASAGALLDVFLHALSGVSEATAVGRRPVSDVRALAGNRDPSASNGGR